MRKVPIWAVCLASMAACSSRPKPPPRVESIRDLADPGDLRDRALGLFSAPIAVSTTKNPSLEARRVELGRLLYFDRTLSKGGIRSCNDCHDLSNHGVSSRHTVNFGESDGSMPRRDTPSTLNVHLNSRFFWDGRYDSLQEALEVHIKDPTVMGGPTDQDLRDAIAKWIPRFGQAFPHMDGTFESSTVVKAFRAFLGKLITPSPFDEFLSGRDNYNRAQLQGLEIFIEQCAGCHMGPNLGGTIQKKLGHTEALESRDPGLYAHTKNPNDRWVFRVPSLRNIRETAPYMSDGSIAKLDEMVRLMSKHESPAGELKPEQVSYLIAFFSTLSGALPEPVTEAPSPSARTSTGLPRP